MIRKFLALMVSTCTLNIAASSSYIWKSNNGHSFEGTLVEVRNNTAVLKSTEGRVIQVPLSALDESSRRKAVEQSSMAQTSETEGSAEAAPTNAVFTHRNAHMVFSLFENKQWATIEFLKSGLPQDLKYRTLRLRFKEKGSKGSDRVTIKPTGMKRQEEEGKVTLELAMSNDTIARFVVDVTSSENFQFTYELDTTQAGTDSEILMGVWTEFTPLLEYQPEQKLYVGPISPQGSAFAELPKLLDGYVLEYRKGNQKGPSQNKKKKKQKDQKKKSSGEPIPFHVKQDKPVKGAQATLHMGKGPGLLFSVASMEGKRLNLGSDFYGGAMPAEGFRIGFGAKEKVGVLGPYSIQAK